VVALKNVMEILRYRLKKHEGVRLKPYRDSKGLLTIGVGRCLETKGITNDEVDFLLQNDMVEAIRLVKERLPWTWDLDDNRFSVLVEMAFQMGIGGLLTFSNFLSYLLQRNYQMAALAMLDSKWAKEDSPKRALELSEIIRGG